jgi:hypothetical protein
MATIKKGILGGFSGTVGPVVGVHWRGKDIIRSRPARGNRTPTEPQLEQRLKFTETSRFMYPIRPLLSRFFGEKSRSSSPFNNATSYYLTQVVSVSGDTLSIDFNKVLLSKGDLTGVASPTRTLTTNVLEVNWTDNSTQGTASGDDLLTVGVYSPVFGDWMVFQDAAERIEATVSLSLPTDWEGEQLYVYAFFRKKTSMKASNTVLIS